MSPSIPRRDVTAFPSAIFLARARGQKRSAVTRLENEFRARFGALSAVATSSGRQGLALLLRALPPGIPRLAYVPAYTIDAVPRLFRSEGFDVEYLDVDPSSLSVTTEAVRRAFRGRGVLLVTHYFGLPADMAAILETAGSLGLEILEDCAHCPDGTVAGRPVGSFGLGGFFSFETRKPLNGLGGGMVVTRHARVAEVLEARAAATRTSRLRDLVKLGMTTAEWAMLRRPLFDLVGPLLDRPGSKQAILALYRRMHRQSRAGVDAFSDFQASLVLAQLDDLPQAVAHKRELAKQYDDGLPSGLVRPQDPPDRPHGYYMYVVQHAQAADLGRWLRRQGVDCGIGDEVLQDCSPEGRLPGTASVVHDALELPMYVQLSSSDVARVCAAAHAWPGWRR